MNFFFPVFKAVFIILMVALISGILVRKKIISSFHIEGVSHILVIILLPCLIFSKIIQYFNPSQDEYWWLLPLIAFAMIGIALGISSAMYFKKAGKNKKYLALSSFMNANYMVLPIGQLAFAKHFDQFATYTFLFVLGVSPALWSVGKYLITSNEDTKFSIKNLLTPPFSASVIAIILVLSGINKYIPSLVIEPIDFIGKAAVPTATLVLGATIGTISIRNLPSLSDILKVVSTKLFILPLITILILKHTNLLLTNPLLADLLVIQSSVAPASQLIIQVKKYGGDTQNVGYIMLISYIICLFTIPAWFTFWKFIQ